MKYKSYHYILTGQIFDLQFQVVDTESRIYLGFPSSLRKEIYLSAYTNIIFLHSSYIFLNILQGKLCILIAVFIQHCLCLVMIVLRNMPLKIQQFMYSSMCFFYPYLKQTCYKTANKSNVPVQKVLSQSRYCRVVHFGRKNPSNNTHTRILKFSIIVFVVLY